MLISRIRLAQTLTLALIVGLSSGAACIAAPISLTTFGVASTQNFDGLSNTAASTTNTLVLPGWALTESGGGTRDNEQYAVDTGASTNGDMYSYGSAGASDRALGALRSGTLVPIFGVNFQNNTGSTITSLLVEYIGEQWRLGGTGRADRLDFQYSLNATDLVTGAWTDVDALDFSSPFTTTVGAVNGNVAANRAVLASTIGLSVANGAGFWLRWTDLDVTGSDDGLAVDNFSLTANGAATPPVAVPEPGSLALALAGLALLGLASQRRKR